MNYHSDEWIMQGVQRHYEVLLTRFHKSQILGIFYQGSGNYGADEESSDIDSWAVIIPNSHEQESSLGTIHLEDTNEVIWVVDLNTHLNGLLSSDPDYLNSLYTKYYIVNQLYQQEWKEIKSCAELFAKNMPVNTIEWVKHRIDLYIQQFQYDLQKPYSKKLYLLMVWYIIGELCINNEPYGQLYNSNMYASELSETKKGKYTFMQAKQLCIRIYSRAQQFKAPQKLHNNEEYLCDLVQKCTNNILLTYERIKHELSF